MLLSFDAQVAGAKKLKMKPLTVCNRYYVHVFIHIHLYHGTIPKDVMRPLDNSTTVSAQTFMLMDLPKLVISPESPSGNMHQSIALFGT